MFITILREPPGETVASAGKKAKEKKMTKMLTRMIILLLVFAQAESKLTGLHIKKDEAIITV